MKRATTLILVLGLGLAACAKTQSIGGELGPECGKKKCLSTVPATASPTKSPKKSPSATPPKSQKTQQAKPPANTHEIKIRDVFNGFEPNALRVLVGDKIIFRNLDTQTPTGHSFTGNNNEWDSKIIKPRQKWEWIVDLKPGLYHWHDENIQYLVGGPLEVVGLK